MFRSIDISNISALGSKLSLVTLTEGFADGSILSVTSGSFDPSIDLANILNQSTTPNFVNQLDSAVNSNQASRVNFLDQLSPIDVVPEPSPTEGVTQPSTANVVSTALLTLLSPCYMRLRSGPVHYTFIHDSRQSSGKIKCQIAFG